VSNYLISGLPVNHTGRILCPRDHYLQKPFSCTHLLEAIADVVDKARRAQRCSEAGSIAVIDDNHVPISSDILRH
jgi:DNA-binding response OmpR family regulator